MSACKIKHITTVGLMRSDLQPMVRGVGATERRHLRDDAEIIAIDAPITAVAVRIDDGTVAVSRRQRGHC